jgi:hypothetical protein
MITGPGNCGTLPQAISAAWHSAALKTEVEMEKDFTPEDIAHLERFGELAQPVLDRLADHAPRNKLIVDHYCNYAAKFGKTIVPTSKTGMTAKSSFEKPRQSPPPVSP